MNNVDTRQVNRDSLFLLAQVRVAGDDQAHRIKVRNLSAGGMMAEGDVKVMRGSPVQVELRNVGWIDGSVAWKQDNRFGIAFAEEIDPRLARAPAMADDKAEYEAPRFTRNALPPPEKDPAKLRKI